MKFCDERIQQHLLNGGEIKRNDDKYWFNFRSMKLIDDKLCYTDGGKEHCELNKDDLTSDDWEILKLEYDWNKIIKEKVLCVFNYIDNSDDLYGSYPILGYLIEYKHDEDYKFTGVMIDSCKADFKQCKPFSLTDYNIAKNLKEYEK